MMGYASRGSMSRSFQVEFIGVQAESARPKRGENQEQRVMAWHSLVTNAAPPSSLLKSDRYRQRQIGRALFHSSQSVPLEHMLA